MPENIDQPQEQPERNDKPERAEKPEKKTVGESRVRTSFNPSNNGHVDKLKKKFAELINMIEELKTSDMSPEKARTIALAQTELESAGHWAIKAVTF